MARHTVQLNVTQSTFIDKANPNTNYGNLEYLRSGIEDIEWRGNVGTTVSRYVILINWPHDVIPPRKKIISATLALYSRRFVAAAYPYEMLLMHEVLKDWDESTATYNNARWSRNYSTYMYRGDIPLNSMLYFSLLPSIIHDPNGVAIGGPWLEGVYAEFNSTRASSNRPYIEVVYEDVPPDAPTPKSPIGIYKDSKSAIRFEWQYNSDVGGEQKAFDLQWSTDQVNWNTISDETSDTFYDMPAETLPAGNIYWRVRTYNEYDEASEYSDIATFYSIAAPNYAVIQSISNAARPVIQWQADNQQVFQIQILQNDDVVYDSGEQPGVNTRSHKVNAFLEDGTYVARIRLKKEYDLWGDWATYHFKISTTKPGKPVLSVQRSPYGLELTIGNVQGEAYIYRDGVPIAKVTGQKYFDHTVANGKEYRYFVRALSANGFADSDTVIGVSAFRFGLLNVGEEVIELKYNLNSVPDKDLSCVPVGAMNHYDGRELPVAEMSEFTNHNPFVDILLQGFAKVEKFMEAARRKKTVLYRDKRLKVIRIISNVAMRDLINGYTVSFTIIRDRLQRGGGNNMIRLL